MERMRMERQRNKDVYTAQCVSYKTCSLPIRYFGLTLQLFPIKKGTSILQSIMLSSKCQTVIPLDTSLSCPSLGIVIPIPCSYSLHIWQDAVLEAAYPSEQSKSSQPH